MKRSDPPLFAASLLAPHLMVYDTIYTPLRTPLLAAAADAGALGANGRSMLLHQGALSFEIWFGRKAPLEVMRAAFSLAEP
jgi:shikimate dehydrogenase